jgi:hypothetical protein
MRTLSLPEAGMDCLQRELFLRLWDDVWCVTTSIFLDSEFTELSKLGHTAYTGSFPSICAGHDPQKLLRRFRVESRLDQDFTWPQAFRVRNV